MKNLLIVALLSCLAHAETIPTLTVGDRTFTNASVRKINPYTVMLRDAGGPGSTAITNLPEPFKSQFLDTNEIKRVEKAAKDRADREASDRAAMRAILQRQEANRREATLWSQYHLRVETVQPNGFLATTIRTKNFYATRQLTENQRNGAYIANPGPGRLIGTEEIDGEQVFVVNRADKPLPGQKISVNAKKAGSKSVGGQTLTVLDCGLPASSN